MGWEIPPHITPHEGDVYSNFPGIFLFLELLLLLAVASSGPLLRGSSFFSWGPSYFLTLGVTNWFLFGERFLPLGKTFTASCLFKITTNSSSLEKDFCFLDLEKEIARPSILFSWGARGFCFSSSLGLWLASHTPPGTTAVFWRCQSSQRQLFLFLPLFSFLFFCFSSFLVISATNSSAWAVASFTTTRFFHGISLVSQKDSCSSTCSQSFSPNTQVDTSEKQSVHEARWHLLARF